MKFLAKLVVIIAAIGSALALWYAIALVIKHSGIPSIQAMAFWISHISITGWIFIGLLAFAMSKLFLKLAYRFKLCPQQIQVTASVEENLEVETRRSNVD